MNQFYPRFITILKYSSVTAAVALSLYGCITPDDKTIYNNSVVMFQQGQQEEAYENIQKLCDKFPDNKQFCDDAAEFKKTIYDGKIELVKKNLGSDGPLPVETLTQTDTSLKAAEKYAASDEDTKDYRAKLTSMQKQTEYAIAQARKDADTQFGNQEYFKAYDTIKSVTNLNPSVLNPLLSDYSDQILSTVKPMVKDLADNDRWSDVSADIDGIKSINPSDPIIAQYADAIKANNNPQYFIAKGDTFMASGDIKKSIDYYTRASAYKDAPDTLGKTITDARIKLVQYDMAKGVELAGQELNDQAYTYIKEGFSIMRSLPIETRTMITLPNSDLNKYYDSMFFHGQKAEQNGAIGLAYFYFKMLNDLTPSYQGLATELKAVTDKISARAYKKISVSEFKSPATDPELGLQASNNIMQILQKQLSSDLKIIERSEFDMLMREHELSIANNTAPNGGGALKLNSLDYIIAGDVLDSRTETHTQESKKRDRVQVSTEKVRNIEWEDWDKLAQKSNNNRDLPPEPQKYVDKPVYDYAEYDVKFIDMISYLSISYRVIDPASGNIIYTNTVQSQKEAKDYATTGVDLGSYKVPMKTADLPTNIELSNQVRKDVIDKISSQIIDIFKDQDEKYISSAEKLEAGNNLKDAVEMYANGIILMQKKKMDTSALEEKVGKYLDVLASY